MYKNITGIILADTNIARWREEAALTRLNVNSTIEYQVNILKSLFKDVVIVAFDPDEFKHFNVKVYPEIYVSKGSLAQIHTGLFNSLTERNFILSSEYPFMSPEMIDFIINYDTEAAIVLPKAEGSVQVLTGVYSKKCIPAAEDILNRAVSKEAEYFSSYQTCYKVARMIDRVGAKVIPAEAFPGYSADIFYNMKEEELQEVL
jgi:molybdenum cofactor guanylyltransferase